MDKLVPLTPQNEVIQNSLSNNFEKTNTKKENSFFLKNNLSFKVALLSAPPALGLLAITYLKFFSSPSHEEAQVPESNYDLNTLLTTKNSYSQKDGFFFQSFSKLPQPFYPFSKIADPSVLKNRRSLVTLSSNGNLVCFKEKGEGPEFNGLFKTIISASNFFLGTVQKAISVISEKPQTCPIPPSNPNALDSFKSQTPPLQLLRASLPELQKVRESASKNDRDICLDVALKKDLNVQKTAFESKSDNSRLESQILSKKGQEFFTNTLQRLSQIYNASTKSEADKELNGLLQLALEQKAPSFLYDLKHCEAEALEISEEENLPFKFDLKNSPACFQFFLRDLFDVNTHFGKFYDSYTKMHASWREKHFSLEQTFSAVDSICTIEKICQSYGKILMMSSPSVKKMLEYELNTNLYKFSSVRLQVLGDADPHGIKNIKACWDHCFLGKKKLAPIPEKSLVTDLQGPMMEFQFDLLAFRDDLKESLNEQK